MTATKYSFRHAVQEFLTYPTSMDGRQSDDHGWSYQSIVNKLLDHRAIIIDTVKMENGSLSDAMRQVIQCVMMRRAERVECACAPPDGCYWAKSIHPIPTPIIIDYVSDVRGSELFSRTSWRDAHRLKHSRTKSKLKKRHYFLREDGEGQTHLYVILPSPGPGQALNVPAFTLAGVFMNPIEIAQYPTCDGGQTDAVCAPLDVPFFTDRVLRPLVFGSLSQEILRARGQAPLDNINNDALENQAVKKPLQ